MQFKWNEEKNILLKNTRNICFSDLIENGEIIDIIENKSSNHLKQQKLIIRLNNKIYSIPFVYENSNDLFLKTAFRESKLDKIYNKK